MVSEWITWFVKGLSDPASNKQALRRSLPVVFSSCFFGILKLRSSNDSQDSSLVMYLEYFNWDFSYTWGFVGKMEPLVLAA